MQHYYRSLKICRSYGARRILETDSYKYFAPTELGRVPSFSAPRPFAVSPARPFGARPYRSFARLAFCPAFQRQNRPAFYSKYFRNLVDGYDRDFISVASDRVDTPLPAGPCRRGINKEVNKRKTRSVNAVYGFGLTVNPSLVLPDPL